MEEVHTLIRRYPAEACRTLVQSARYELNQDFYEIKVKAKFQFNPLRGLFCPDTFGILTTVNRKIGNLAGPETIIFNLFASLKCTISVKMENSDNILVLKSYYIFILLIYFLNTYKIERNRTRSGRHGLSKFFIFINIFIKSSVFTLIPLKVIVLEPIPENPV